MGYLDNEEGYFDFDTPNYPDDYIFDYVCTRMICSNCVPKWVQPRPTEAQLDNLPQIETRLLDFEYRLPKIKFPVTESEFIKDKELKKRVEKYNNSNKKGKTLELEPLYYLTLYVYDLAKAVTVDFIYIGESRLNQLAKLITVANGENAEITFKAGKKKFVLTDKELIQFLFGNDEIISRIDSKVYKMLNSSDSDLTRKSENFSYTDASSVFVGYMYEYFENDNSAKEMIAYLTYLSGLVMNESIIVSNDYINILLRNYRFITNDDKKRLYPNMVR